MPMTVETLQSLEPEELGARLLLALRDIAKRSDGRVHSFNSRQEFVAALVGGNAEATCREPSVINALVEAWTWLEAQGLLVPDPSQMAGSGFRVLSRRAQRFETLADFVPFRVARMLEREMLNPRIRDEVWAAFIRGHFTTAADIAMKRVESAVREACPEIELYGKPLMAKAFASPGGPLTDRTLPLAEQEGMRDLFTGAIGMHRNALAHDRVTMEDAAEVVEVVVLANHLLRIVGRSVGRRAGAATE